jgi:hypothetical protein
MSETTITPEAAADQPPRMPLLRPALAVDAAVTPANGGAYVLAAGPLDDLLGLSPSLTTFGTPADITVEELSIESFFPADRFTAETLRRHPGGL